MKNTTPIILVLLIGVILSGCGAPTIESHLPNHTNTPFVIQNSTQILESSVLITIQSSSNFNELSLSHGIGTLVEYQTKTFLVTHNHWGSLIEDNATVELRDSHSRLITPMFGRFFKDLIVYQDPSTLVLRTVPELLNWAKPAQIDTAPQLESGTIVQVAYRQLPDRKSIAVLNAQIIQTSTYEEEQILEIHCLGAQGLQKGDSGGGVWLDGRLVGNNWAILISQDTVKSARPDQIDSSISKETYSALLPEYFQSIR